MSKLWGGRFEGATDSLVETLGESVSFDARLATWDIQGSLAHAQMLGKCGIISEEDADKICVGLASVLEDIASGLLKWNPALEDVHTNIEAALVEKIGDAGKRLHTGRSRNDQIATDIRLWMRDQIDTILLLLGHLQLVLIECSEEHLDVILPGYTHLQPAQPVLLAHHLLAYTEMFQRDAARFSELRNRVNILPLGSAALAGTPYPIDRNLVAEILEFDGVTRNSMDAVSDRDHLVEFVSDCALVMMHLSRFSEELILWSCPQFGFIEIGDAFTTGSSIMPQKKNPDVAELVRGKTGRVYGDLTALLVLMKGLPMTYNRDLQEDKEPLFDASDTTQLCLEVYGRMIPAITFNREVMADATRAGFMEATDLADYLVTKGVPFREAHGIVGRIVRHCLATETTLPALSLEEYQRFSPKFEEDIHAFLEPETLVSRRNHIGGTAPSQVLQALQNARERLTPNWTPKKHDKMQ